MMHNAVKVVLFCCVLVFITTGQTSAFSKDQLALTDDPFGHELKKVAEIKPEEDKVPDEKEAAADPATEAPAPPPVQHVVIKGDSLSKIAAAFQTTWTRLYAKNTQLADPNSITPGDVIIIPAADEQLADRALPAPAAVPHQTTPSPAPARHIRGSSAGNTYAPGYCTWYAKSRRPDLPNRLGNASSWVARAAAQGFATGSTPRAGAIGQQGNHVVYIEHVNGDGTVTVSEMNYRGRFIVSSRTTSASNFTYIY